MNTPYTYRITFIPTMMHYYGVRYAKKCNPSDLWQTYFTSSRNVKELIRLYGKDKFTFEVRKIFETKEDAIKWEERVTRKVIHWDNYLNANSGKAFNHDKSANGGVSAFSKKVGVHSLTFEQKSVAGKKGAEANLKRRKEKGFTQKELDGFKRTGESISKRRLAGLFTEKELLAIKNTNDRRRSGNWTSAEKDAYARLTERRQSKDWTKNEIDGFNKTSSYRKNGKWITDGSSNKFTIDENPPCGWVFGFTRRPKQSL